MSTQEWEPLPRDLKAIKELYPDLPPQVVHQVKVSLAEGGPLAHIQLKRLIEYAGRFGEGGR